MTSTPDAAMGYGDFAGLLPPQWVHTVPLIRLGR
jgi:hypothetical protein